MNTEEIIKLGKDAIEILIKFPYLNAAERKYHEKVALIGKLAEDGGITIRNDPDEIRFAEEMLHAELERAKKEKNQKGETAE